MTIGPTNGDRAKRAAARPAVVAGKITEEAKAAEREVTAGNKAWRAASRSAGNGPAISFPGNPRKTWVWLRGRVSWQLCLTLQGVVSGTVLGP